ncbi:MAG: M48 family metallopeptidase [Endomicrobium sp.]|uniref:M48 family metallopeptidase n=1 Tax=Candidatus Endomicrobiellum pyrsonymphae TaxID=1408203 RepID=UPI00358CA211|nr:M48 family metallopeptidase [Endomicrobium sp.]
MAKITTYDFIESNTRKTVWLMILFPISLAAIVYLGILFVSLTQAVNISDSVAQLSILTIANQTAIYVLPVVTAIAILWILISYYAGQNFILSIAGAVKLTKQNAPEVVNIVENIAITAGLPIPRVYSVNDEGLNAFATGRDPEHSCIVLTKGIINKLEVPELEGVIAHEIAHIGNRDIRLMLIMIVCISFATVAAEMLLRFALTTRTNNSKNNRAVGIQALLFVLAVSLYMYGYLVAPLIKLAVSRTREFQADATAALITRNPNGLISALEKISGNSMVKKLSDKQTMSPMCIANPLTAKKQKSFFAKVSGLFATHPPIEDRIKALQTMDGYRN